MVADTGDGFKTMGEGIAKVGDKETWDSVGSGIAKVADKETWEVKGETQAEETPAEDEVSNVPHLKGPRAPSLS